MSAAPLPQPDDDVAPCGGAGWAALTVAAGMLFGALLALWMLGYGSRW